MKAVFGTILHKNHGGAFTETGAADLYGTLPGGRAIYIELKTPERKNQMSMRRLCQKRWLDRERKLGAATFFVSGWDELKKELEDAGIYPQ